VKFLFAPLSHLCRAKTQIPAIDRILLDMTHDDPERRLGAQVALDQLRSEVHVLHSAGISSYCTVFDQTVSGLFFCFPLPMVLCLIDSYQLSNSD